MSEYFNRAQFHSLLPRLLGAKAFRAAIRKWDGKQAKALFKSIDKGETPDSDLLEEFAEWIREEYFDQAKQVLSVGWDGDFPGNSGAFWLYELAGVCIFTCSDRGLMGPYESLEAALDAEYLSIPTPNPSVDSDVLTLEQLLQVAAGVVDWENEGEVSVNNERYVVKGGELVPEPYD